MATALLVRRQRCSPMIGVDDGTGLRRLLEYVKATATEGGALDVVMPLIEVHSQSWPGRDFRSIIAALPAARSCEPARNRHLGNCVGQTAAAHRQLVRKETTCHS